MQSKKFDYRLDLIRVIASVLVVGIHSDSLTTSPTNYVGGGSWWIAAFFNSLGRTAVPLFVMLAGALILPKVKYLDYRSILARIRRRLLFPLVMWTAIYFYWRLSWFGSLPNFNEVGHLYYLYLALGLYLVMPILPVISYPLLPLFGSAMLLISLLYSLLIFPHPGFNLFFLFIPYLGYLLLGAVNYQPKHVLGRYAFLFLAMISALVSAYLLYLGNTRPGAWWVVEGQSYFWGHFAPTTIITTLSLWYLSLSIPAKLLERFGPVLRFLSSASFGIYLAHPFITTFLERKVGFEIHLWDSLLIVNFMGKWILAYLLSLILTLVIRRLGLGRYLLGE